MKEKSERQATMDSQAIDAINKESQVQGFSNYGRLTAAVEEAKQVAFAKQKH